MINRAPKCTVLFVMTEGALRSVRAQVLFELSAGWRRSTAAVDGVSVSDRKHVHLPALCLSICAFGQQEQFPQFLELVEEL